MVKRDGLARSISARRILTGHKISCRLICFKTGVCISDKRRGQGRRTRFLCYGLFVLKVFLTVYLQVNSTEFSVKREAVRSQLIIRVQVNQY